MMTWYDDIMRTIIELPEDQIQALDGLCRRAGISRAEAIRQAVASHVRLERQSAPDPAFGLWRGRGVDGLTYERRLRGEWDRPRVRAGRRRR